MTTNEKALQLHEQWQGKLDTVSKVKVNSREALSLAYTPGVAEPCKVIAEDKEAAYKYTMKSNTVAVSELEATTFANITKNSDDSYTLGAGTYNVTLKFAGNVDSLCANHFHFYW